MLDKVTVKISGKPDSISKHLFGKYKLKPYIIYAVEINEPFEVVLTDETLTGQAGDFLVVDHDNNIYPCDRAKFITSFMQAEKKESPKRRTFITEVQEDD
jgi:hypothetical protein